ncbi:MAG: CxxC-x17-CxxC domain-containing protein [Candidatus Paceibacteria bacterium]|jgi:CxxC-x17-CxxC domain-containing protein
MDNYNKGGDRGGNRGGGGGSYGGNRGGGGGSYGGNRGGGGGGDRGGRRDFGAPKMHKADCDGCGKVAELPFKPTGDKPVFCSACFSAKREESGGGDRRDSRESRGGDRAGDRGGDRGARRNDRDRRPAGPDMGGVILKIDALQAKMDKILLSLNLPTEDAHESETVFRAEKKVVAPKKPKAKNAKDGDLKKAVNKVSEKKTALKKAVKKAPAKKTPAKKKVAKKTVKKAAKKKVAKKKK